MSHRRCLVSFAAASAGLVGVLHAAPAAAQWAPPGAQAQPAPAAPQPAPPAPAPYGGMQSGGLTPPPPMAAQPAQPSESPTAQELDKAKEKDSGRGLEWVYLNVEGGFEHVGLQTFSVNTQNFSAGLFETSASGGMVGAGLGLRLLFITLGARGRIGLFNAFQMFSAGGELGLHIPIGNLEPRIDLGAGYVGLGALSTNVADTAVSVRGYYARVGGGLDYYITPVFSVGASVSWELLGLTRPGVDISTVQAGLTSNDPRRQAAAALQADGTAYGSALALSGVLGLHF